MLVSVKEPNCAQSFIWPYFIIYSLFPVCIAVGHSWEEGEREFAFVYLCMCASLFHSLTLTDALSLSLCSPSVFHSSLHVSLPPLCLSLTITLSLSLWLSLFPSFSHLLTCTHARTCTHTHKHTQYYIYWYPSTFFYNACMICHYLIGDKTCHSDKTCRNSPHMVEHCPNWNPWWWWWWWWWWRCYFSWGKSPAGLHK